MPYLLVLTAFALRVYRLAGQSLWYDEGWSVYVALHNAAEALLLIAGPGHTHPPLYYLALHAWGLLAGFSEFSARFLSAAFSLALVALTYALAREAYDRRTALVAMAIIALAPLHVTYAQEARMYSLFALLYPLLLYLLHGMVDKETSRQVSKAATPWFLISLFPCLLATTLALYTHYLSVLILAYLNLLAVVLFIRRQRGDLRRWMGAQILAALAYLPWIWVALRQTAAHVPLGAQPPGLATFASQTWHFYLAGALGVVGTHTTFMAFSWLTALALVVALPITLRLDPKRRQNMLFLSHTLVPLGFVFVLARLRPGVHPRYVMMLSTPLFILMGRAIGFLSAAPGWRRLIGVGLGLALALTTVTGLWILYFDTRYHKDDVRAVARYLEGALDEGDAILFPYEDYAFRYYYHGPAPARYLDMKAGEAELVSQLQDLDGGRVALVTWHQSLADRGRFLPFLLELSGRLVEDRDFPGLNVKTYQMESPVFLPPLKPLFADFGPVQLTGAYHQATAPADNAVCLALRWRLTRETGKRYKATVSLWDGRGRKLASRDAFLLDGSGRSTEGWQAGQEAVNTHVLPIPIGTPPLTYALAVGVYEEGDLEGLDLLDQAGAPAGKRFALGTIQLTRGHRFDEDPYHTRRALSLTPVEKGVFDGALALEGFALDRGEAGPGEAVNVILQWRALKDGLPDYAPQLRLVQGGAVIAEAAGALADGLYPTSRWSRGEVVVERRQLVLSLQATEGSASLEIAVGASSPLALAELRVEAAERLFTVPPMEHPLRQEFGAFAELLGYDVAPTEVTTADEVVLTLYWRARNEGPIGTSYTVFTHLLSAEGKLVGQHDGLPARGSRPTTSWVRGEIIVDVHRMRFKEAGYVGPVTVEIGFYDAATGQRVATPQGEDRLLLPTEIVVEPMSSRTSPSPRFVL
ncbi:MAG: glycosyltransferase family 39 protein [Anaerolineae bacterium]